MARKRNGTQSLYVKHVLDVTGLSRKELATKVGVSPATIDNWVGGFHDPGEESMKKMAAILKPYHKKVSMPVETPPADERGERLDKLGDMKTADLYEMVVEAYEMVVEAVDELRRRHKMQVCCVSDIIEQMKGEFDS